METKTWEERGLPVVEHTLLDGESIPACDSTKNRIYGPAIVTEYRQTDGGIVQRVT